MENEKKVIVTETIMLYPRGDKEEVNRVYTYLRNGMKAQAQMMNIAMCTGRMQLPSAYSMPVMIFTVCGGLVYRTFSKTALITEKS